MKNKIVLNQLAVNGCKVEYKFSVSDDLKQYFETDTFFIQYDQEVENVPVSILTIPFVNCMAALSWLSDAMLFVDEIDATYYESFKQLKRAYSELHSMRLKGLLVPSIVRHNIMDKSDDYLLLFGGGVDCHSSFLRNKERVRGVVNIYGWLKEQDEESLVDKADKLNTQQFAQRFGIKYYHVRSNFVSQFNNKLVDRFFCKKLKTSLWYGFLHSMAFLSIATPLAWSNGISNIMIASSFTKDRVDVHCGSYITTDSEYRFAQNGSTLHDGFELSRQEKVAILVEFQEMQAKPYFIQACSFNYDNCCGCSKCLRTIYELAAEGADPRAFGFNRINGSLQEHIETQLERNIYKLKIEKYYYQITKQRMRQNYGNIRDKEFVDWFLSFDFDKAKRKGLIKYYRKNFFSILKRKIHMKSFM